MSLIKSLTKSLVPAAVLMLASQALATEHPPKGSVKIKSIDPKGSGCPTEDSVYINISDDNLSFLATFAEFSAAIGPGLQPSDARKNCALTATLSVPAGWQFAIATFNYRGFMQLDKGIKAVHSTSYWFQGEGETGYFKAETSGPAAKDFVYTDKIGISSVYIPDRWSPCNKERALIINPSVSLRKGAGAAAGATGLIANDSVDGEIDNVFGLKWRRC